MLAQLVEKAAEEHKNKDLIWSIKKNKPFSARNLIALRGN
jgi:hypothetical protein